MSVRENLFLFTKGKKNIDSDGLTYYTIKDCGGKSVKKVTDKLTKVFPDYSIINLSNRDIISNLIVKYKKIIIYCSINDNTIVDTVEIYL